MPVSGRVQELSPRSGDPAAVKRRPFENRADDRKQHSLGAQAKQVGGVLVGFSRIARRGAARRRPRVTGSSPAALLAVEVRARLQMPKSVETRGRRVPAPSSVGLRVTHGACVTALSAFTCPCPYQELYPGPPAQVCGAPFETDGNGL